MNHEDSVHKFTLINKENNCRYSYEDNSRKVGFQLLLQAFLNQGGTFNESL